MRETDFIKQNKDKWTELESLLRQPGDDPDKLSNLFIQVTDDLSYSRTFYPNRSIRVYLNNIAQQIFYRIHKTKKQSRKQIIYFWKEELPQLIYHARKDLIFSLVFFVFAVAIGVISSANDAHFSRVILGDEYVDMTMQNIKKGDPMAVYKQSSGMDMFLGITLNNVKVAFMTFLFGIFFVVGTLAMLLYNGIMVGTFQYFFYEHKLFVHSFLSIWLHGTIEMSSIIIAAGAGITMGRGLLFPGTYSRMQAFVISARRGVKILIGIVPLIVFAAIIESFMTRYTDVPGIFKAGVILFSLVFVFTYFVWYPYIKNRRGFASPIKEVRLRPSPPYELNLAAIKTNGEIFKDIFIFYRNNFKKLFRLFLILAVACTACAALLHPSSSSLALRSARWFFAMQFFDYSSQPWLMLINSLAASVSIFFVFHFMKKYFGQESSLRRWGNFINIFVAVSLVNAFFFIGGFTAFMLITVVAPFLGLWIFTAYHEKINILSAIPRTFTVFGAASGKVFGLFFILAITGVIYFFMINSPLVLFYFEILNWNLNLEHETMKTVMLYLMMFTSFLAIHMIFPMVFIGSGFLYYSLVEISEAKDLNRKINSLASKIS